MLERHRDLLLGAALTASCLLLYGRAVGFGFVWDDHAAVEEDAIVRGERPAHEAWTRHFLAGTDGRPRGFLYRPLVTASLRAERAASSAPWIFHLDNLLLHVACTLLVLLLGRRLGARRTWAVLGAALFAASPVTIEAVAWISGRPDLLLALGVGLSAAAVSLLHERRATGWAEAGAAVGLLGALLSKEPAIVAAPVLALGGLLARRDQEPLWPHLRLAASCLGVLLLTVLLRSHALGALTLWRELSGDQTPPGRLARLGIQLGLLAGFNPQAFPQVPVRGALRLAAQVAGAAVPTAMLVGGILLLRRRAALAGLLLLLAPALLVPVAINRIPAARYLYAPLLCLAPLAGLGLQALADRRRWPRALLVSIAAALVVAWAVLGQLRLDDWRSDDTLFAAEAELDRENPDALFMYGDRLLAHGQVDRAIELYRRALAIEPRTVGARLGWSRALLLAGRPAEAERVLRGAPRAPPPGCSALALLARSLSAQGKHAEAREIDRRADALCRLRSRARPTEGGRGGR
jgi:protein O-mannosyl-transferase